MSEPLIHEYRGDILENEHRGFICGITETGQIKYSVGNADTMVYLRSSAKPIQALAAIKRGVDHAFGLTEKETVLLTASHRGEPFHVKAIESMLEKFGVREEQLLCSPAYPNNPDARAKLIRENAPARRVYHNCAGKHLGIMALSKLMGVPVEGYWEPDHPAQTEILHHISLVADCPKEEIHIGVDGCGVPVFALPLRILANSYLRLACPDLIADYEVRHAVIKITELMNRHHEMVTGTHFICSTLLEDPNIVAKGGAKGVYCFGLKKERLGFSLKIADGTEEGWPLIIASMLEQIGYDNRNTIQSLYALSASQLVNDNHRIVGMRKVVFQL